MGKVQPGISTFQKQRYSRKQSSGCLETHGLNEPRCPPMIQQIRMDCAGCRIELGKQWNNGPHVLESASR